MEASREYAKPLVLFFIIIILHREESLEVPVTLSLFGKSGEFDLSNKINEEGMCDEIALLPLSPEHLRTK